MTARRSVGTSVALLLATGIALGLGHNQAGLLSRPPRGIPWLAQKESPLPSGSAEVGAAVSSAPLKPSADSVRHEPTPAAQPTRVGRPRISASPLPAPPATRDAPTSAPVTAPPEVSDADHPVAVELAGARRLLDADAALFLDARDSAEYEAGHIPGAMRLTRDDVLADPARARALPVRGRPIITYCEGGECEASLDLANALVEVGYRKVLVYAGGFPEWSAAGQPVERGRGR